MRRPSGKKSKAGTVLMPTFQSDASAFFVENWRSSLQADRAGYRRRSRGMRDRKAIPQCDSGQSAAPLPNVSLGERLNSTNTPVAVNGLGLAMMIVSSLFPGGVMQLYVDSCAIIGHGSNDLNLHALDLINHSYSKS